VIDLPNVGGPNGFAVALNARGDAAGNSTDSQGVYRAAAWFNRNVVDLGINGELMSYANGINDANQVAMISEYPDTTWHSFIWERGVLTEIPRVAGDIWVEAINNAGTACGQALFSTGYHAFLWKGAMPIDLDPTSVLASWSSCNGINAPGQVVGWGEDSSGVLHPFVWRNAGEGIVDLNSTIPASSGVTLFNAFTINGRGQIAAAGWLSNGQQHAFRLTPAQCTAQN